MGQLSPPFAKLTEISRGLSLEERKIAATERRIAVLEKIAQERAAARQERAQKHAAAVEQKEKQKQTLPNKVAENGKEASFAARRAETAALMQATRTEIADRISAIVEHHDQATLRTAILNLATALRS